MNAFLTRSAAVALTVVCAAAICTGVLTGCVGSGTAERSVVVNEADKLPTVTVTADSKVNVVPDKAEIGVAVTTQAATADDTQARNANDVNAVIDALRALGIDEKNIQTSDTWLNPRYNYNEDYGAEIAVANEDEPADGADDEATTGAAVGSDESSNIVGYEMTTRLSVKDLDIDKVGEVLQACVAAGANDTDGIRYYSSDYDAKYAEALAAAVDEAHTKAETLAKASGLKLGRVYSMTEGYQDTSYRYEATAMESAADGAMKTMPGEIDITANVTVSYEVS